MPARANRGDWSSTKPWPPGCPCWCPTAAVARATSWPTAKTAGLSRPASRLRVGQPPRARGRVRSPGRWRRWARPAGGGSKDWSPARLRRKPAARRPNGPASPPRVGTARPAAVRPPCCARRKVRPGGCCPPPVKKILLVIPALGAVYGGPSKIALRFAAALARRRVGSRPGGDRRRRSRTNGRAARPLAGTGRLPAALFPARAALGVQTQPRAAGVAAAARGRLRRGAHHLVLQLPRAGRRPRLPSGAGRPT